MIQFPLSYISSMKMYLASDDIQQKYNLAGHMRRLCTTAVFCAFDQQDNHLAQFWIKRLGVSVQLEQAQIEQGLRMQNWK